MDGIVYMIESNNLIYIGSTKRKIEYRIYEHKRKGLFKLYDMDPNNYSIKILEECIFDNKIELRKKEQEYINKYNCVNQMNSYNNISKKDRDKEYYKKNRERLINQNKEYVKRNRDKVNQYYKDRYKYICSWGGDKQWHNNLLKINLDVFN